MSEMVRLIGEMIALGWIYAFEHKGILYFNSEEFDSSKEFQSWDEVAKFVEGEK